MDTKINIRESLNKYDLRNNNKYDLRNLYDSCIMDDKEKRIIAEMIYNKVRADVLYEALMNKFEGKELKESTQKKSLKEANTSDGIRVRQLRNNITAIVDEYLNGIYDGYSEEFPDDNSLVDFVYDQLFDMKDNGGGHTRYAKGICDDLKYLGRDFIVSEIIRIGHEEGVVAEQGQIGESLKESADYLIGKEFFIADAFNNYLEKYFGEEYWSDLDEDNNTLTIYKGDDVEDTISLADAALTCAKRGVLTFWDENGKKLKGTRLQSYLKDESLKESKSLTEAPDEYGIPYDDELEVEYDSIRKAAERKIADRKAEVEKKRRMAYQPYYTYEGQQIPSKSSDYIKTIVAAVDIPDGAFQNLFSVEKLIIFPGVKSIGTELFTSSPVRLVYIPDSVENISKRAFKGIYNATFYCSAKSFAYDYLTKLDLDVDTNVKTLNQMLDESLNKKSLEESKSLNESSADSYLDALLIDRFQDLHDRSDANWNAHDTDYTAFYDELQQYIQSGETWDERDEEGYPLDTNVSLVTLFSRMPFEKKVEFMDRFDRTTKR